MDFEEFYKKHKGFLWHCANRIAKKYGCLPIKEDLVSEGMLAAFRQIGRYDGQRGASVNTFLHPHIVGAMRREAERYLNWSRRELQKGGTQLHARKDSLDEAAEKDSSPKSGQSVEQQVYINICLEHLRAAFGTLSFRERETLGGFFGVFGHKKETLAEIGEAFQIKEIAALKAKDKAFEKLCGLCLYGEHLRLYIRLIAESVAAFVAECRVFFYPITIFIAEHRDLLLGFLFFMVLPRMISILSFQHTRAR